MLASLGEIGSWSDYFGSGGFSVERLAAAIFVNCDHPASRLMGMFTAYMDASGNAEQEDSFIVVSGYIANLLQWRMIENVWKGIHAEFDMETPFHMAEFMAATSNPDRYAAQRNARSDYVAISKDIRKAQQFFEKICIAQQGMVNCGISCIVDLSLYGEIGSLLDLRKTIPPYALAARTCQARIREWECQFDIKEPVEVIFEKGDLEQDKFTALVTSEGREPPIYRDKMDYAGLQAADHCAWEQFYYLKKQRTGDHLPVRESFKFLLNFIPAMHLTVTRESLINVCHAKGIDPRTGVKHGK